MAGCDTVFHLAANADLRHGLEHPRRDLEQNTIATSTVLEAMRAAGVTRIVFSSTGSVYGEPDVFPTPEDCPFPVQTSLYAASKLAGEGLIAAYCHGYGFTGVVYRFVSILGERYTHGHVYDFVAALRRDPTRLRVLGDGRQEKSYLYVGDCVEAILTGLDAAPTGEFSVFNLGTDETLVVDDSIATICAALGVAPRDRAHRRHARLGGDSPLIHLDTTRIRALGWAPELTIARGRAAHRRVARGQPVRLRRGGRRMSVHLHARAAAHLARRRRHRPAVVLPRARRLPRRRARSTSTSTC